MGGEGGGVEDANVRTIRQFSSPQTVRIDRARTRPFATRRPDTTLLVDWTNGFVCGRFSALQFTVRQADLGGKRVVSDRQPATVGTGTGKTILARRSGRTILVRRLGKTSALSARPGVCVCVLTRGLSCYSNPIGGGGGGDERQKRRDAERTGRRPLVDGSNTTTFPVGGRSRNGPTETDAQTCMRDPRTAAYGTKRGASGGHGDETRRTAVTEIITVRRYRSLLSADGPHCARANVTLACRRRRRCGGGGGGRTREPSRRRRQILSITLAAKTVGRENVRNK